MANKLTKFDTEGMNKDQAFKMLKEIYKGNPLGTNEELIYNEILTWLEDSLKSNEKDAKGFNVVKDGLTNKQWQKIWSEL